MDRPQHNHEKPASTMTRFNQAPTQEVPPAPERFPLEKHEPDGLLPADHKALEAQRPEPNLYGREMIGTMVQYVLTDKDLKGGRSAGEIRPALIVMVAQKTYKGGTTHKYDELVLGRDGLPPTFVPKEVDLPAGDGFSVTVFLNGHGINPDGAGDGPGTLWKHGLALLERPIPGQLSRRG